MSFKYSYQNEKFYLAVLVELSFFLCVCLCVQQKKRKKFHKLGAFVSFSSFCFACF